MVGEVDGALSLRSEFTNLTAASFTCQVTGELTAGLTARPDMDQFDAPYFAEPMSPVQVPFGRNLPQAPSGGLTSLYL